MCSNDNPAAAAASSSFSRHVPDIALGLKISGVFKATSTSASIRLDNDGLSIWREKDGDSRKLFDVAHLYLLYASISPPIEHSTSPSVSIDFLNQPSLLPVKLILEVSQEDTSVAEAFIDALMKAAYPRTTPKRRIYLLVNPIGGKGKAKQITRSVILPILKASRCSAEVIETAYHKHAVDLAQHLDISQYDVIGCVSGDGLVHEVLNGFAVRDDAAKCLAHIPLVPVPAGSANSMSINIHGKEDGFSAPLAALNLVKGHPLPLDLSSVSQANQHRKLCFMSQAVGLMADLDLGTEHLRWMGDTRFVVGALKGVYDMTVWKGELYMKSPEGDKGVLLKQFKESLRVEQEKTAETMNREALQSDAHPSLPELQYPNGPSQEELKQWVKLEDDAIFVYAGHLPLASRDLIQWPLAQPGSGLMDVAVQLVTSRIALLKSFPESADGLQFPNSHFHYYKTSAFHVIPPKDRLISVDGEPLSSEPFTVECHPALGRTLGLRDRFEGQDDFIKKGGLGEPTKLDPSILESINQSQSLKLSSRRPSLVKNVLRGKSASLSKATGGAALTVTK